MTTLEVRRQVTAQPAAGVRRGPGRTAVALWALLIAATFGTGLLMRRAGLSPWDELPPLHAQARLLTWQILPAAGVAVAAVAVLPALVRRLAWRPLLLVAWATAVVWAVALAVSDGFDALAGPLAAPTEYPAGLAAVRADPLRWLRTFTEQLWRYPTHVRGHPPLPTLVLWALDAAGLRGTGWAAAMIVAVGGSAVAAVAVTVRHLAGEEVARRAVPFLALAPFALWIATAMDAFFLGVGAWAIALTAIAARRGGWFGGLAAAAGSGLLLGALPYLSYGLLPLFAVPAAVLVVARPRWRVVAAICGGLMVIPGLFTLGGFWWPDGVAATLDTYLVSPGSAQRPYGYFLIADLAVLGLLVGPAVAYTLPCVLRPMALRSATRTIFEWVGRGRVGLGRAGRGRDARRRSVPDDPAAAVALLVTAALLGTIALDLAGVTRGEVERIWVPYAAWVVVAAAAHRPPARGWLAVQAATALALQALVLSEW